MIDQNATTYVLAMHGAPPRDFPPPELSEFFQLHAMAEVGRAALPQPVKDRMEELGVRMRAWPRTPTNDPFHAASYELAAAIQRESGRLVEVGFNEFCDPDVEAAVERAIAGGAARVIVLTPMLTRGGDHAESDIPRTLERVRQRHLNVAVDYAWPFPVDAIARFLLHAGSGALDEQD
jgi:sirohydrochlorin cobaltochelatase